MEESRFQCEGLPEGEIIVGDIRDEVPEELVCKYFGPKSSKSGWKYTARTTPDEQAAILSLYQRVYDADEMPNKEITLQFARGLIMMSLDKSVNWSQFSHERLEYRAILKTKKEENAKKRFGREVVEAVSLPSNLAKKRCVALGARPLSFKLTMKSEQSSSLMENKGLGAWKKVGPFWLASEIDDMGGTIEKRSALVQVFRNSLSNVSCDRVLLDDNLRRARMLLTDRQVLICEAQDSLVQLNGQEFNVRSLIEESASSPDVESVKALMEQLDTILFEKSCQERTERLSKKTIVECESTISSLESKLEAGIRHENDLHHKVISLEGFVEGLNEQLRAMTNGEGAMFWPRPLPESPELPMTVTHTLNACPVCCMWYSCFDYVPISCGHCYHPWCLYEHTKKSNSCKIEGCNAKLHGQHGIALGLRPQTTDLKPSMEVPSLSMPLSKVPHKESPSEIPAVHSGQHGHQLYSSLPRSGVRDLLDANVVGEFHTAFPTDEGEVYTTGNNAYDQLGAQGQEKHVAPKRVAALDTHVLTHIACGSTKTVAITEPVHLSTSTGYKALSQGLDQQQLTCSMCLSKLVAVKLTACEHSFCFSCIRGLKECPDCKKKILGWRRQPQPQPQPPQPQPLLPDGDSDNDDLGLQHYCNDDIFKNGGMCSISVIEEVQSITEKVAPKVQKKKQTRPTFNIDTLNHTRVLERPMAEILEVAQSTEVGKERTIELPKRKPARPAKFRV